MDGTSRTGMSAKGILGMLAFCLVAGHSSAATWDPIEDAEDSFQGNPYYGAQIATAETRFLPSGGQIALTKLVAITDGEDHVRLYSLDTSGEPAALDFEDEITISVSGISTPIAYLPAFMAIDITGNGAEPCLVIPSLCDTDQQTPAAGSISVVRLTERDQYDRLEVIDDCFYCTLGDHWSVYSVSEIPGIGFAISTEFGENPPPDIDENVIVLACWSSANQYFQASCALVLPDMYYGSRHDTIWSRAFATTCQEFLYGEEYDGLLCYTTAHNGGVVIWDPTSLPAVIVSRISVAQQGGWEYDPVTSGELGDVHRAVVLEGGSSSFPGLDDIEIESRLLFFSDNTMGFVIYDISKPDEPQYVWQWDCDTRPCEEDLGVKDWAWHGAGDVTSDSIVQAAPGYLPGETFGIGVASNSEDAYSPATIHLYLAGGVDGLRRFDLTDFLDPFGRDTATESDFDDFVVDGYVHAIEEIAVQAHDLQTLSEDGDTYVFTSWREERDATTGTLGLTVHLDEDVVCD